MGSRKLKINAKETMRVAEKLYTQGLISYPRTETNIFPDSFDLGGVVQQQTGDPQWGNFAARLLTVGPTPRRGTKTDNAHPPIYPTKYSNGLSVSEYSNYKGREWSLSIVRTLCCHNYKALWVDPWANRNQE